jgi:DNA-binding transcriptional MocR family regulator
MTAKADAVDATNATQDTKATDIAADAITVPPTATAANKKTPSAWEDKFRLGWSNTDVLSYPELKENLKASFEAAVTADDGCALNYGDNDYHRFLLGKPDFLQALATFLGKQYDRPCDQSTLMTTSGASMGIDLVLRAHFQPGDYVVCEGPTFFNAYSMLQNAGLKLLEVPICEDGMDLDALEKVCADKDGKVKLVYTIPIHHNPTGITMSNAKRQRLVQLAKKYDFKVIADEAYQLLNFGPSAMVPLFYDDNPTDPRVISISSFSKLIGPGVKIGWIQAHPALLKPLGDMGFIQSGHNPVIFMSNLLKQFITSGNCARHIAHVSATIAKKKDLMVDELRKIGLKPNNPAGGYFLWLQAEDKRAGRSGTGMSLAPDSFNDYVRICFAYPTEEEIVEGVRSLEKK